MTSESNLLPSKWRLRTATEDLATVHGEVNANRAIGNITLTNSVVVADIENGFILDVTVPIVLGEDTTLSERTEVMVRALLDGSFQEGDIMMLETESHDKQIQQKLLVAKEVVNQTLIVIQLH
ncbi:hypothetical protein QE152_g23372 [Popillia japonica]|uniref:Uncharacterized protein n=1 Tax=Popillia japonica TaxID=7064 RepID=A0AAW1KFF1_POPJA